MCAHLFTFAPLKMGVGVCVKSCDLRSVSVNEDKQPAVEEKNIINVLL